jgi:PIN domain nuclease of toxin-antitoxin system
VKTYIFDACALIAYFAKENGADKVKNLLRDAIDDENVTIYMNF